MKSNANKFKTQAVAEKGSRFFLLFLLTIAIV